MTWSNFIWFALPAIILWLAAGSVVYLKGIGRSLADLLMILGVAIFAAFIVGFWIHLERPPMRTMGETRLWYSLFLSSVGYVAYIYW
ncbi:MAG: cytochrome C assembly protein, partial [Rikenellaceae bacterium]